MLLSSHTKSSVCDKCFMTRISLISNKMEAVNILRMIGILNNFACLVYKASSNNLKALSDKINNKFFNTASKNINKKLKNQDKFSLFHIYIVF